MEQAIGKERKKLKGEKAPDKIIDVIKLGPRKRIGKNCLMEERMIKFFSENEGVKNQERILVEKGYIYYEVKIENLENFADNERNKLERVNYIAFSKKIADDLIDDCEIGGGVRLQFESNIDYKLQNRMPIGIIGKTSSKNSKDFLVFDIKIVKDKDKDK